MKYGLRLALLLVTATGAIAATPVIPAAINAAVADPDRPTADRALDTSRKPAAVIAFAGVRPGMVVAELDPGRGYYTRLLARTVGPTGRVLAIVTTRQAARPGGLLALDAIAAANRNVTIVTVASYAAVALPRKADLFWTTENYHDFHNGPGADIAGLNRAVYANLRRGGVFYVEDHSAVPGAGLAATSTLHRMDETVAKEELAAAGFTLAAESSILRNPADDRSGTNSENGQFSSDRFMLKLRK